MQGEAGLLPGAQTALDAGQRTLDEPLEICPIGGVVRLGIGRKHHVPTRTDALGFGAQAFEEESVEVAGIEVEAGGEFGAGAFEVL